MRRLLSVILTLANVCQIPGTCEAGWLTQESCSQVVDEITGNETISKTCVLSLTQDQFKEVINGLKSSGKTPRYLEHRVGILTTQLDVTRTALNKFFKILSENEVPVEGLDAKLREIAAHHHTLLNDTAALKLDDPVTTALKQEAIEAVKEGQYDHAEALLQQAKDVELHAIEKTQQASEWANSQRRSDAAEITELLGELKLTQLAYTTAADNFRAAADLGTSLMRAKYLDQCAEAAQQAGHYPEAEGAFREALAIRENFYWPEHPVVAISLSNLARLYKDQGRFAEAELLVKRALAIREKTFAAVAGEAFSVIRLIICFVSTFCFILMFKIKKGVKSLSLFIFPLRLSGYLPWAWATATGNYRKYYLFWQCHFAIV